MRFGRYMMLATILAIGCACAHSATGAARCDADEAAGLAAGSAAYVESEAAPADRGAALAANASAQGAVDEAA